MAGDSSLSAALGKASEAAVKLGDGPLSPTQTCAAVEATCDKAWDEVTAETKTVIDMPDKRARNRRISALYSDMNLRHPELKWAGAAAFASKQVGCGMDDWKSFPVKDVLEDGNGAVFKELYPMLRFYDKTKGVMSPAQVKECLQHKPPPALPGPLVQGLGQVMEGKLNSAAHTMLRYEQSATLQESVYNNWRFKSALWVNAATGNRISPINVAFSATCESGDPVRNVTFSSADGQLDKFVHRMPYAEKVAVRYIELSEDSATRDSMLTELRKIQADGQMPTMPAVRLPSLP